MAELNTSNEVLPSKRKQPAENLDAVAVEDSTKKHCTATAAVEEEKLVKNGDKNESEIEEEEEEEEEDYDGEDEIDSEEEEGDNDDEIEHSNGDGVVVDRKGKGIMKDDKGKGKMIEESEGDDDSDSDDDSDDDSGLCESDDLSDDPLAEVDLDNILPSRTRGRTVTSGLRISSSNVKGDDHKDDNDA